MAELLLVNPSRRKRKTTKSRRRNPLSKSDAANVKKALKSRHVTKKEKASLRAAIKAMHKADREAALAGVKPSKRKPRKTKRKSSMAKSKKKARRVKFSRSEARKYAGGKPTGARFRKGRRIKAVRAARSKRVHRAARIMGKRSAAWRRYSINPLNLNQLQSMAIPALAGALGGFVINTAFDKIEEQSWYPEMLKNDYGQAAAKAALVLGAGMLLERVKIISPSNRNAAMGGALVIIAYDLLDKTVFPKVREMVGMSGYQLAGYQDVAGLGEFEYIDPTDDMAGLGYVSSAPVVGFTPAARTYTG